MSWTIEIVSAELSGGDEEAWAQLDELREEEDQREHGSPPSAVMVELHRRLTARYPCILEDEKSPWSGGPLIDCFGDKMATLGIVGSQFEEALAFVIETATDMGLTVFDAGDEAIHRPKNWKPSAAVLRMPPPRRSWWLWLRSAGDRWRARREKKRAAVRTDAFWAWFASIAADGQQLLRREPPTGGDVSPDLSAWIHELNWRAAAYHPLVRAVVGTSAADLELVLTSDGNPGGAAEVRALAESAPALPGWTIRAFKPRLEMSGCVCRVGEVALTPDDVDFAIIDLDNPEIGTFTLFVPFIPGFAGTYKKEVGLAADQLLQAVLGEERVIRWSPFIMKVDSHQMNAKLEAIPRKPLPLIVEELESLDHRLGPTRWD